MDMFFGINDFGDPVGVPFESGKRRTDGKYKKEDIKKSRHGFYNRVGIFIVTV